MMYYICNNNLILGELIARAALDLRREVSRVDLEWNHRGMNR